MRRHLGKARYPVIVLLAAAAVFLFIRVYTSQSQHARAAMMPLVPGAAELEAAVRVAGIQPEALAAAGVSPGAVGGVAENALEDMSDNPGALELAQTAMAQARQQRDQLMRLVQSGQATPEQVNACAAAVTQAAQCDTQLQGTLQEVFDAATSGLSNAQRGKLATIRGNRRWDLPTEFLVVNRPEAQWVLLRDCLANERIAASLGQQPSADAQVALVAFRSNPLVALAKASLDANLGAMTAAWQQAFGP